MRTKYNVDEIVYAPKESAARLYFANQCIGGLVKITRINPITDNLYEIQDLRTSMTLWVWDHEIEPVYV